MAAKRARPPTVALIDRAALAAVPLALWQRAATAAFRAHARATLPAPLFLPFADGGIHVKAAALARPALAVLKANANLPSNPAHGRPAIQGLVLVFDARSGAPLALIDSAELTAQRTAAGVALAARLLARPRADTLTLFGCGMQARAQLAHVAAVRRLRRMRVHDLVVARAESHARWARARFGCPVHVVRDADGARDEQGIVLCCTSSREPYLGREQVAPGCFVAAIGADHPDKRELRAELLESATLVVDSRAQCAAMGELHHAVAGSRTAAPPELAEVLARTRSGRTRRDEIVVFDSTGLGIQDAYAAAAVLRSRAAHAAARFDFTRLAKRLRA